MSKKYKEKKEKEKMRRDYRWNKINGMLNGKEVFLLGSGTSLDGFDFRKLDKKIVIGINHSIEHYWTPMLVFGDKIFLSVTSYDIYTYKGIIFCSEDCTGTPPIDRMYKKEEKENVYVYEKRRDDVYLNAKMGLYHHTSAGLQALNLALQMRAKTIYLLGYDYYKKNGRMHFYPDYDHHKRYDADKMAKKVEKFNKFEQYHKKIINLSPNSLINIFPKRRIEDVLG